MKALADLYRRWRQLVHELAKFGIVGAVNTVVDFGVFNFLLLNGLGHKPLVSNMIALTVAATSSFFMNRYWTFRHRGRTNLRREYTLFFLLNLVGLAISLVCVWLVRYGFALEGLLWLNAAKGLGLVLGMAFRFTTYRRWVFVSEERAAELLLAEAARAERRVARSRR